MAKTALMKLLLQYFRHVDGRRNLHWVTVSEKHTRWKTVSRPSREA